MNQTCETRVGDQAHVIDHSQSVRELVLRYPPLRQRLEQLGVDYCCGGKKALVDAVSDAGLRLQDVLAELQQAAARSAPEAKDWTVAGLEELVDHILQKHHTFMKEQLPRLDALLKKVRAAHGEHHGQMLDALSRVYSALRTEIDVHLMKEEQVLFPAIKAVAAFAAGRGPRPVVHCGSVQNPIMQMEYEHDSAGHALKEIRTITDDFRLPGDACPTFASLYDGLQALEADLHEHIHLENNILFPRSVAREAFLAETGHKQRG